MSGNDKHRASSLIKLMRDEGGASAAEFAIVVLPMTIIFLVIIQFGFILYVQNSMQNAAREAARRMVADESMTFVNGGGVDCEPSPRSAQRGGRRLGARYGCRHHFQDTRPIIRVI